MTDVELEPEVSRFLPFFYPTSQSTSPTPRVSADALIDHLKTDPDGAGSVASDLPTFLLYFASHRPAHTDNVLKATQIVISEPSLPRINNWDSSRPNATFEEMFHVAFRECVHDAVRGPIEVEERTSYIGGSLLAARARSLGLLDTPEIVGSLAEGLALPGEVIYNYQGDVAEIAAAGACIQLLGGISVLIQKQPSRLTTEKLLSALNQLRFPELLTLIEASKAHLQSEALEDLTSEGIVE